MGIENQENGCQIKQLLRLQKKSTLFEYACGVFLRTLWFNYHRVRNLYKTITFIRINPSPVLSFNQNENFKPGDFVRVKTVKEIRATLNSRNEMKGCTYMDEMWQYAGTTQRVFKRVEKFIDERNYRVKRTKGLVLLESIFCGGTKILGTCDRSCFFFWREEWLEKIDPPGR